MRIFKYILLLALLLFIGLTVFVSAQKADFDVAKSKIIKTPRPVLYNFVNDLKNRELFDTRILNDTSLTFEYSDLTSGVGATSSWNGTHDGKLITRFVKENDSISQTRFDNGIQSSVYWKFKDTIGGTKVTWSSKGKLDFKTKIMSFFTGGINSVVGNEFERSLENLNKTLNFELNTFAIKVDGIVNRSATFYVKQIVISHANELYRNIRVLTSRMNKFITKSKLTRNGTPFVSYSKYDKKNDLIGFSMNFPIQDSIFIAAGSDVQSGKLKSYTAVKITLTGAYTHTQQAWKKGYEYIAKNNLKLDPNQQVIELYSRGIAEEKSPSKWITEIYIPVLPKVEEVKTVYKKPDSLAVKTTVPALQPDKKPINQPLKQAVKQPVKQAAIPDEFKID